MTGQVQIANNRTSIDRPLDKQFKNKHQIYVITGLAGDSWQCVKNSRHIKSLQLKAYSEIDETMVSPNFKTDVFKSQGHPKELL
jgi:hypothetical protein